MQETNKMKWEQRFQWSCFGVAIRNAAWIIMEHIVHITKSQIDLFIHIFYIDWTAIT